MKKNKQLSEYAIDRLLKLGQARLERKRRNKRIRSARAKKILWAFGDVSALIILMVAIATLGMLDSASFVPAVIFLISVIVLTIYGAFRGVLG